MPLDFETFVGIAGNALRTQRGAHHVFATGTLVFLATMIPQFAAGTRAGDGARIFDLRHILWLGLSILRLGPDIPAATRLFQYIANVTRIDSLDLGPRLYCKEPKPQCQGVLAMSLCDQCLLRHIKQWSNCVWGVSPDGSLRH